MEIIKKTTTQSSNESEIISSTTQSTIAAGGTVKDCLRVLVAIGFIELNEAKREYKTTERGERFAAIFQELSTEYAGVEKRDRIIPLSRKGF